MINQELAVIFDMDGVIVDSNPYHKISLQQFCQRHGYDLSEEQLKSKIYGRTNKDWIPALFDQPLSQEEISRYGNEKEALFRDLFSDDIALLPGLKDFLGMLQGNSIPMAIATSAPRDNVDFVFEKTGIKDFFPIVLDESHISKGKPDPEIYLKACEALQMPPGQCVVFEDSLSGVKSGLDAGTKVIAVTTTHTRQEFNGVALAVPDFADLSLQDLQQVVDK